MAVVGLIIVSFISSVIGIAAFVFTDIQALHAVAVYFASSLLIVTAFVLFTAVGPRLSQFRIQYFGTSSES